MKLNRINRRILRAHRDCLTWSRIEGIDCLRWGHAVTGPLKYHIAPAKEHGVTREEMVEIITQLAFYAGWPKAWAAFPVARKV